MLCCGLCFANLSPYTLNLCQTVPSPPSPIVTPVTPTSSPKLEEVFKGLPRKLDALRQELGAPGAALVVVQDGHVLDFIPSGSADLDGKVPITDATIFRIASNTKVFTSTMMFLLRDEGTLKSLDAPITDFFPSFRVKSPYASRRPIVLRSLAMHASGLCRETPCDMCSEEDVLAGIANTTLLAPQYGATHYSNLGVGLLGRALEKIIPGKNYSEFIEKRILAPLGMVNSGFYYSADVKARMARGVDGDGNAVPLPPTSNKQPFSGPAGEMYSSPADIARFMMASMRYDVPAGVMKDGVKQVLDGATFAEAHRTGMMMPDGLSGITQGTFEAAHVKGHWAATKSGCLDGYRSAMAMVPALSLGVFAVATSTCDLYGDGDAITFPVLHDLIPAVEEVLEKNKFPSPPDPSPVEGAYCFTAHPTVVTMNNTDLVLLNGPGGDDLRKGLGLNFTLEYIKGLRYRMHMRGEYLASSLPGCSVNGQNACPVSSMRKCVRGDENYLVFEVNAKGDITGFAIEAGDFSCTKIT